MFCALNAEFHKETEYPKFTVQTATFIPSHFYSMPLYKLLSGIDFKILPCENTIMKTHFKRDK